jgi:hypothetical protein
MIDRSRIEIIAALSRRPRLRMNMAAHRGMQRLCIGVRQVCSRNFWKIARVA